VLTHGTGGGGQSSLLDPVDPSFRALSGRIKITVRRHTFKKYSLSGQGKPSTRGAWSEELEILLEAGEEVEEDEGGKRAAAEKSTKVIISLSLSPARFLSLSLFLALSPSISLSGGGFDHGQYFSLSLSLSLSHSRTLSPSPSLFLSCALSLSSLSCTSLSLSLSLSSLPLSRCLLPQ